MKRIQKNLLGLGFLTAAFGLVVAQPAFAQTKPSQKHPSKHPAPAPTAPQDPVDQPTTDSGTQSPDQSWRPAPTPPPPSDTDGRDRGGLMPRHPRRP